MNDLPKCDVELREYLIALLECTGDDAPRRQLAIRADWHRSRHSAVRDDATLVANADLDRSAAWAQLEDVWEQFHSLSEDSAEKLTALLACPWDDVRDAAARVVLVRQSREKLIAAWPRRIERSLLDWLIEILIRPPMRSGASQQSFGEVLWSSPATAKAYQRFSRKIHARIPELTLPDLMSGRHHSGAPKAQQSKTVASGGLHSLGAWFLVLLFAGLVILGGLSDLSNLVKPAKPDSRSGSQVFNTPAVEVNQRPHIFPEIQNPQRLPAPQQPQPPRILPDPVVTPVPSPARNRLGVPNSPPNPNPFRNPNPSPNQPARPFSVPPGGNQRPQPGPRGNR